MRRSLDLLSFPSLPVVPTRCSGQQVEESDSANRRLCGLRLFRRRWGLTTARKQGGPRYSKNERTNRECL